MKLLTLDLTNRLSIAQRRVIAGSILLAALIIASVAIFAVFPIAIFAAATGGIFAVVALRIIGPQDARSFRLYRKS